jgi:hypothetical protein
MLPMTSIARALAEGGFVKDIKPVLQQNCIKTGRRSRRPSCCLDSRDAALEGGKGGPTLIAGAGARSEYLKGLRYLRNSLCLAEQGDRCCRQGA